MGKVVVCSAGIGGTSTATPKKNSILRGGVPFCPQLVERPLRIWVPPCIVILGGNKPGDWSRLRFTSIVMTKRFMKTPNGEVLHRQQILLTHIW